MDRAETNDDLNLRLARYFEPEPEWHSRPEHVASPYYLSKKRCWWKGNGYTQEVRDFTKEPDLLKMMLEWLVRKADHNGVNLSWWPEAQMFACVDVDNAARDLQTAVCHATLKAIETVNHESK